MDSNKTNTFKRLALRAAKLPIVLLLIGAALVALSHIDEYQPLVKWKQLFLITDQVGLIIIILAFICFIYNLLVLACDAYENKLLADHANDFLSHDARARAKGLYTKMRIIRNIANVIIIILAIAAVLMSFNSVRNIGISLLASAGFLTAIIGLAAQRTLTSLFAGLQIAFSQPIKIGDVVVIDKESGIVEEITLTYVTLKLGDRRRLVVPISYFIEKPFENWSHKGHSLRSSLHFHVDYLMPIEPIRAELDDILNESPFWDKVIKKLQVADIDERSVEIRIQISASSADNLADLQAEVREKMLTFMRKHHSSHLPLTRMKNL